MLLLHKRVIACLATDVFGVVVFVVLAYLVVWLLWSRFSRSYVFVVFSSLVVLPRARFLWSWVAVRRPLGLCPYGLDWGFPLGHPSRFRPRPSGLT